MSTQINVSYNHISQNVATCVGQVRGHPQATLAHKTKIKI
jgi:hypothetical protein